MSKKEKLIARFKTLPKDFLYEELVRLLSLLDYKVSNKGKTSGSRVRFLNKEKKLIIDIHRPHASGMPIKETALKDIYNKLISNDLINNKEDCNGLS